jgi:hypothetical protein
VRYKWRNDATNATGDNDKPSMVAYVDEKNIVYVSNGTQRANVGAIHPAGSQAYLRTYADGTWTNNLLSLPTF